MAGNEPPAVSILTPADGFRARLTCLRRQRRGKNMDESALWQHELEIPTATAQRGPFGTMLRLGFEIPFECEPTSSAPERLPSIRWRLEVDAEAYRVRDAQPPHRGIVLDRPYDHCCHAPAAHGSADRCLCQFQRAEGVLRIGVRIIAEVDFGRLGAF